MFFLEFLIVYQMSVQFMQSHRKPAKRWFGWHLESSLSAEWKILISITSHNKSLRLHKCQYESTSHNVIIPGEMINFFQYDLGFSIHYTIIDTYYCICVYVWYMNFPLNHAVCDILLYVGKIIDNDTDYMVNESTEQLNMYWGFWLTNWFWHIRPQIEGKNTQNRLSNFNEPTAIRSNT